MAERRLRRRRPSSGADYPHSVPHDSITLVAPYLVPNSIGPRAARSRKIAAGLQAAGHELHAVVIDDGLPPDPTIEGQVLAAAPGPLVGEMGEPGMNARRRLRAAAADQARRAVPLPDAHIRWATALARDPALERPPSPDTIVYAVAAPFSSLVLGAILARRWGVPLIGDLGDPWPARGAAEARLARWTMSRLSSLVVTNQRTADAYRDQLHPGASIVVAPNGADELERSEPEADVPPLFLQLGTLSNLRVDPASAYGALAELDREGLIRFRSHGEAWVRLAPEAASHHLGVIPEDEARTLMRAAAAVLVVGNRNAIQIPSKVYEIARSEAWGLCVSELDREPGAEILRESGHGVICGNDEGEIRAGALEILARERRGERPQPTSRFSWEETVVRVVALLDDGVSAAPVSLDATEPPITIEPGFVSPPVQVGRGTALLLRGSVDPAALTLGPLRVEVGSAARAPAELSVGHETAPGEVLWWALPSVQGSFQAGPQQVRLISGGTSLSAGEIELVADEPAVEPPPVAAASGADPLVAICMATYEPDAHLLRRQIESIRAQEWGSWICLISDDASSPEGWATVQEMTRGDERFVLSRSPERLGFYRNFERALGMAPPEAGLIALSDQDDRWYPDKLRSLHETLLANPDARLAYSDMRVVDEGGRVISNTFWYQSTNAYTDIDTLAIVNTVAGGAALFRRSVLDVALPFPPAFSNQHYHDHWLALCALAVGGLAYLDRPTYDYTRHSESITVTASRQWTEPPTRSIDRAINPVLIVARRLRLATKSGTWPNAFFDRYLMLRQFVLVLRLRAWDDIAPDKRRALGRIERADRSPAATLWLAARTLRPLLGRRETLGRERVLLGGLAWRWKAALTARRRRRAAIREP